ncbi:MAG: MmgE/PrpD family protein [Rhodobacteraceae bacterium]|nr:MmgE/PrpD family protein [Paracoccaceae bacterium]
MTENLTTRLAQFASRAVVPSETAKTVARLSALDWIAVGRSGTEEPVARIVLDLAMGDGGAAQAHVFGSDIRLPARAAALVNGTTSHALDYDDTHLAHIGHPSVVVFSAALAMAQAKGASVPDMLTAALIGMETSIRVGLWLGRTHYQTGFHQTATAGTFGAAVAAARLLGLDALQTEQVLGLTATRAAGLKAQFGTMGKPYNAGFAAAAGVEAAQLVDLGLEANPQAMLGAFGFGATHHGEDNVDAALQGLGDEWLFESVSHKFHACCHGLHAALEALREVDVAEQEISEIMVHTHPRWMSVCNQRAPTTGLGAKFSYGTVLAMMVLGHDTARPDRFSDAICNDPRVVHLRDCVEVIADEDLSETEAIVAVLRRDGSTLRARYDLTSPVELEQRVSRVQAKAGALIGTSEFERIWHALAADTDCSELI